MEADKRILTDEEEIILYEAASDFQNNGKTDILCPRCGKKLEFIGGFSSFGIYCEDKNCVKFTCRGI